jgi:hypothetical protein
MENSEQLPSAPEAHELEGMHRLEVTSKPLSQGSAERRVRQELEIWCTTEALTQDQRF